jgi:hypothetical protein
VEKSAIARQLKFRFLIGVQLGEQRKKNTETYNLAFLVDKERTREAFAKKEKFFLRNTQGGTVETGVGEDDPYVKEKDEEAMYRDY